MFTSKPPTCAGRTLALPRKDRDIRYLRPLGNSDIAKVLPDAHLGFAAYGELNEARDNVIVYPTWYTGLHHNNDAFIGNGRALDPAKYFILVPDMFTNGLSTSPSNCAPPCDGMHFPLVTPYDNVIAQHRLLTEHFAITRSATR